MSTVKCFNPNSITPEERPIYNHIMDFSKNAFYTIVNVLNGGRLPQTIEQADTFIEQYKQLEVQKTNLAATKDVEQIRLEFITEQSKVYKKDEEFFTVEGDIKLQRVSDIVDIMKERLGYRYNGPQDNFKAKKGTVLHSILQKIANELFEGKIPAFNRLLKDVREELKLHKDFKDEPNSFFEITLGQFNSLVSATNELKKSLDSLQKEINPKGKYQVFTELLLFDKTRNVVGTADMVVLFSDGSAAVYDYKTKSFGKRKDIGTDTKTFWYMQLGNYSNMLRNGYGVTKIREARVIPIDVDFSGRENGEYVSQIEKGFQSIAINNAEHIQDYLKPLAFGERTDDINLNSFLQILENKRNEYITRRQMSKNVTEKVEFARKIKGLDTTLQSIYLSKDIDAATTRLKQIGEYYQKNLHKDSYEEGGLSLTELLDGFHEISAYDTIIVAFNQQLDNLQDSDSKKYKKLSRQVADIKKFTERLKDALEKKVFESFGNEMLYSSGQRITVMNNKFGGLDSFNNEAMNEMHQLYTKAMELAREESEEFIYRFNRAFDDVVDWGKQNGYSLQAVQELFFDEDVNLVQQHTPEFYTKFRELTKKFRGKEKLNKVERQWLIDNYEIDHKAWELHKAEALKGLKKQLDQSALSVVPEENQKRYEEAVKLLEDFAPEKGDNFFRGNTSSKYQFIKPKKGLNNYYSSAYQTIQANKPLLEYYNLMKNEIIDKYQKAFGRNTIGDNFIPNIHKDFADMVKDGTAFMPKEMLKMYSNKLLLREQDSTIGTNDSQGNLIKVVPLYFTDNFNITFDASEISKIEQEIEAQVGRDSSEFETRVKEAKSELYKEKHRRLKSTNLHRSMITFVIHANRHLAKNGIKDAFEGIAVVLNSKNFRQKIVTPTDKTAYDKFVGEVAVVMGADKELNELHRIFTDRLIYGQQFKKDHLVFGKYSTNKIMKAFSTYTSANFVGLHVVLMASNYITARNNFKMFAREDRLFTQKAADEAMKLFASRSDKFLYAYDYLLPSNRDILSEMADESAGLLSKWLRLKTLFLGHVYGDERVDALIANAMANTWVVDSDGVIKNPQIHTILDKNAKTVQDSIEVNGDLTVINNVNIDSKAKFRRAVRKAAQEIKGMADETQLGSIYATMTGAQLMLLRGWMPGMAKARFKTLQYDLTYDMVDQGRYLVAFEEIFKSGFLPGLKKFVKLLTESILMGKYRVGEGYQNLNLDYIETKRNEFLNTLDNQGEREMFLKKYGNNFTIDHFIKLHESKMNALAKELQMYLLWLAALIAVSQAEFEDEDEKAFSVFTRNGREIARRALLELTFWTSPTSAMQIVRSPFALMGVMQNMTKVAEEFVLETSYVLRGERDPNKTTFPGYYLVKNLPAVNRINTFYELFEPYQRPKTTIEKVFWDIFE